MTGFQAIASKIKKLSEVTEVKARGRMVSIVYMDNDRNILWEEGVRYNSGVLVVPLPMTVTEWEAENGG